MRRLAEPRGPVDGMLRVRAEPRHQMVDLHLVVVEGLAPPQPGNIRCAEQHAQRLPEGLAIDAVLDADPNSFVPAEPVLPRGRLGRAVLLDRPLCEAAVDVARVEDLDLGALRQSRANHRDRRLEKSLGEGLDDLVRPLRPLLTEEAEDQDDDLPAVEPVVLRDVNGDQIGRHAHVGDGGCGEGELLVAVGRHREMLASVLGDANDLQQRHLGPFRRLQNRFVRVLPQNGNIIP